MSAAHRNVGVAAAAVFAVLLLLGVTKHSNSASAAPTTAPLQQSAPPRDHDGFGHRGGGFGGNTFNNGTTTR